MPSKWHMSEEAMWEVEALQQYIGVLAAWELEVADPIFAITAFDLHSPKYSIGSKVLKTGHISHITLCISIG